MQTLEKKQNLISIIVPVYNVENYLKECIDSILGQTYTNYELILVDDGSTDSSGIICDKYAEKNLNVSVVHKVNGGLSSARNAGIEKANGDYYVFIDSDDVVHRDYLNEMMKIALQYQADIVACDFVCGEHCYWEKQSENLDIRKGKEVIKRMNEQDVIVTVSWNKLYKSYFFDNLNLRYRNGKIHEDMFLIPELLDNCRTMVITSKKLYFYRQRANSIMNSQFSIKQLDILEALEYRIDFFKSKKYMDLYYHECESYARKLISLYKKIEKYKSQEFINEKTEILSRIRKLVSNREIYIKFTLKNKIKLFLLLKLSIAIG